MVDFLIELVESDKDFGNIGYYIVFYFGILWFLFSLWVFFDAKKRYENVFLASILFITVLILNFPMLIFYLIIRPESEDQYFPSSDHHHSALNIPIVNFISEKGIEMSLNLKVNKELLNQEVLKNDVKVDLSLVSDKISIQNPKSADISEKKEDKKSRENNFKSILKKNSKLTISKIKSLKNNIKKDSKITQTNNKTQSSKKSAKKKNKK